MASTNSQIKLVLEGERLEHAQDAEIVTGVGAEILQATVREHCAIKPGRPRGNKGETITLQENSEVVELALEDNLLLYTSLQRLREEIIPESGRGESSEAIRLPARLSFTNQKTRASDGLLIKSFKILDLKDILIKTAAKKSGQKVARKLAELIEDRLVGPDTLYRITEPGPGESEDNRLQAATGKDINPAQPTLLFIHGTASNTQGSFSELWDPSAGIADTIWQDLRNHYQNNIFALEHRTLTHSPIDNAIDLLEKLPSGCHLHLVSHSRGGLVGELLCRNQFSNGRKPFTEQDIALFDPKKYSTLSQLPAGTQKDYRHYQKQLRKLNTLLLDKQPVIKRFVRVACPARGTTLASGKLDFYLSGVLNVIGLIPALKTSPVYSFLKAFVLAVARERTRPEELPGLETQMPGSPFIAMLNSAPESVRAPLAVIEGDTEATGILKKISLFFMDRFYESDHDLVVNTPSMDGGGHRPRRIPILFDQGSEINHFRYFENEKTRQGLFFGLTDSALPPKGYTLKKQKAVRIARTMPKGKQPAQVPAVFILPGIAGTEIAVDGKRVWVDIPELVSGRFTDLKICTKREQCAFNVEAREPIAHSYGDLIDHLSQSHDVIPFGYDWRLSVLTSGRKLGAAIAARLRDSEYPVRIIAHSMGGLVVWAMMGECPEVWEQMQERTGSRVLMLGTPTRGTYAIARLFARQERLLQMLALVDLRHNQDELLDIFRKFPGFLELLPVNKQGKPALADALWDRFGTVLGGNWKRPLKSHLQEARKTWGVISKNELDPAFIFYVAGQSNATPVSVAVEGSRETGEKIVFRQTLAGDGLVSWKTGIPPGIKHWFIDAEHGDLADYRPAFKGFLQILETGATDLLATRPTTSRGTATEDVMFSDTVEFFPHRDQLSAAAMGKSTRSRKDKQPGLPPLRVSVAHGNLAFTRNPLAVGHYQGDMIVSAEAALDQRLGYRLSRRLHKGVYPGPLMTNDIVFNTSTEQFPGAIIVGLGEVGKLTPGTLTASFRNAVIRFALIGRETRQFDGKPIALSTMLIGTGANRLSIKDSISSLIRGVLQANKTLAGPAGNVDLIISELEFIELYEDVAIEAQYGLLDCIKNVEFEHIDIQQRTIIQREGGRTRAFFREDTDWWKRLRIETTKDGGLKYTTLAANARAETKIQGVQRQSVEPFLEELTGQTAASTNAGRVLFELLIPPELKNHAAENHRLMLVIDKETAAYPWELFEYAGRSGNEALAIKAGMIRQLATGNIVPTTLCTDLKALVVGDPDSGRNSVFSDLPGAQEEARKVAGVLEDNRVQVQDLLIRETGANILTRLMTGKYGILHLAGHGVVDFERPGAGRGTTMDAERHNNNLVTGMVIGKNQFLTPIEIRQMPYTPAFVFLNCCHLGKIGGGRKQHMERRYHLAANLATQLIEQGVKAVIAAGWAVDDKAALTFAETFYQHFLSGACFGEAVKEARTTTQSDHPAVNTWGAYQCYGDPGYRITNRFDRQKTDKLKPFVSLTEYRVAVQNIAEDAKTASQVRRATLRDNLLKILKNLPGKYTSDAKLLTVTGDAWGELNRFQKAIDAYTEALQAQQAHASIHCAEQLANFKNRRAKELAAGGQPTVAEEYLQEAIEILTTLNSRFGERVERLALLGSCYKCSAALNIEDRTKVLQALRHMYGAYMKSYEKSMELTGRIYAYPLLQALTARWLLNLSGKPTEYPDDFDTLLQAAIQANMVGALNQEYFWEAITATDGELLSVLINDTCTTNKATDIVQSYQNIGKVASSARQMRSVLEHVEFLSTMTEKFNPAQSDTLLWIANQLRKLL